MKLDSKGFFTLIALSTLTLLVACSPRIYVEQDASARFAGYRSYAWLSPPAGPVRDPILDSQILEARVQRAVDADLKARGYVPAADAAGADFLVTYHTASKQKIDSSGANFSVGIVDAFPHGFGTLVLGGPEVQSREEGTLMLDVIDGKSKRLVWRGWTTGWLSQDNYTDEAVSSAVHNILDKLPAGR